MEKILFLLMRVVKLQFLKNPHPSVVVLVPEQTQLLSLIMALSFSEQKINIFYPSLSH